MKKFPSATKIGTQMRHRVRIEDDDSFGPQILLRQRTFLQELFFCPELLDCGYFKFQTLRIFHDEVRWVAEAEAVCPIETLLG